MGRPIKIAKAQAVITITATAAATDIVTTSANLNTLGIIAGMPFVVASNVGNLVAGTTYWILEVLSATTFTVSATQLSANPTYAKVDLAAAGPVTVAATVGLVDSGFNNPQGAANTYGVVGGNTALYGNQVLATVCIGISGAGTITTSTTDANLLGVGTDFVNTFSDGTAVSSADGTFLGFIDDIANANATFATFAANAAANVNVDSYVYGTPEAGFIVRQKGKTKYLVQGATSGLVGQCVTANVANAALTPNTMNIIGTYANTSTAFVQALNDVNSQVFYDTSNANANPDFYATFNSAANPDVANGIYVPVVTINAG
jgi:hypothetical protein